MDPDMPQSDIGEFIKLNSSSVLDFEKALLNIELRINQPLLKIELLAESLKIEWQLNIRQQYW